MLIGERIAGLRAAHGETLRQAAERTGVHYSTLARIERGETNSGNRRTLHKVAAGYGVSLESLLHGDRPEERFAAALSELTPFRRLELTLAMEHRLRFVLRFLASQPDGAERLKSIAATARVSVDRLSSLCGPGALPVPKELVVPLCAAIAWESGLNVAWLRWGELSRAARQGNPDRHLQEVLVRRVGERCKSTGS